MSVNGQITNGTCWFWKFYFIVLLSPAHHNSFGWFAMFTSDPNCDMVWGLSGTMLASTYKICNQQGPKLFVNVKDIWGH